MRKSAKSAAIFNMPGWFYKRIYLRATCPNMTASRCIVVTVLRAAEIIKKNFLAIEYSGTTHATITPCRESHTQVIPRLNTNNHATVSA